MIQFLYATHSNRMIYLGWRMLYDKKHFQTARMCDKNNNEMHKN